MNLRTSEYIDTFDESRLTLVWLENVKRRPKKPLTKALAVDVVEKFIVEKYCLLLFLIIKNVTKRFVFVNEISI
jgi:hypothetical protein